MNDREIGNKIGQRLFTLSPSDVKKVYLKAEIAKKITLVNLFTTIRINQGKRTPSY